MRELFTWGVSFICLAGTVLNVKRNVLCFYLWTLGNALWLCYDVQCALFSRALLDVVQLVLAVWGIFEWREDNPD